MKILIIDDDSVIRQLLEDLLPLYLGQADQVFSADDGQRGWISPAASSRM